MREEHPSTHLVKELVRKMQRPAKFSATGEVLQPARLVTARMILIQFKIDYPNEDTPSSRTIANIKKNMEAPDKPLPSNLCKGCKGYGYIYEQTTKYFGDGKELSPNRTHVEVTCFVCQNSGIDPNWERPISELMRDNAPTPAQEVATEFINIPNNQGTQDYEEPLERTL